jgi:hypothetical protein
MFIITVPFHQEEHGVPDQIESVFSVGKGPEHKVVIPDAE